MSVEAHLSIVTELSDECADAVADLFTDLNFLEAKAEARA